MGIVTGAYLAGRRGIVLMQTSGFATLPNALASLVVPFQIPLLMMVSERGTLGDFQLGQALAYLKGQPVQTSKSAKVENKKEGNINNPDGSGDKK